MNFIFVSEPQSIFSKEKCKVSEKPIFLGISRTSASLIQIYNNTFICTTHNSHWYLLFCVFICSLSHSDQGYGSENYCCCDFAVCSGSLKYCCCNLQKAQNFFPKVSAVCRKPDFGNIPLTSTQQKHDTTRHKTMRFYPEATDKQLQTDHFAGATNSSWIMLNFLTLF